MATNGDWLAHKLLTLEQQVLALSRGTQLGNSSMQGTTLLMLDDEGLPKSELGPEGIAHLDGPVPPKPSPPILEQGIGTVFVRWDGLWAAEADDAEPVTTPLDFHVMEVHATTDPELDVWDEDSLAGTISQREGGVVMVKGWDIDDVVYVRLVCRTLADRVGEASEPAEVVIEGIDLAAIVEELDAANVELANLDGTMFAANAELDALRIQFKNLDTSIINTDDGTLTEALEDARQALADAGDRIGGLETSMTEMDSTTLPGLRQDLDAAEGRLGEAEGQITDAFGQIESLEIGAINLANQSDLARGAGPLRFLELEVWRPFEGNEGRAVTLSFDILANADNTQVRVYPYLASGTSIASTTHVTAATTWRRLTVTTTVAQYAADLSRGAVGFYCEDAAGRIEMRDVKVEWGKKATAYSPSPADVSASIMSAETAAEVAARSYTDAQLSSESASLSAAIQAAQAAADEALDIADGAIRTYYENVEPTPTTHPDLKVGDMWYDTTSETAYRWNGTQWNVIQDSNVSVALAKAEEALAAADGKITTYFQGTEPTEGEVGDLWFDTASGNAPYYCSSEDPLTWTLVRDGEIAEAELRAAEDALEKAQQARDDAIEAAATDATEKASAAQQAAIDAAMGELDAVENSVMSAVSGKNTVTWSLSDPPAVYDGVVDDTWFKLTSYGSGGRTIRQSRWNGTVWVDTKVDGQTIANIDAGTIVAGQMEGGRIKAGTISADKMVVGVSQNLVVDSKFKNPTITAARSTSTWVPVESGHETWMGNGGSKSIRSQVIYLTTSGGVNPPEARLTIDKSTKWAIAVEVFVGEGAEAIERFFFSAAAYLPDGTPRYLTSQMLREDGTGAVTSADGWVRLSTSMDWSVYSEDFVSVAPRMFPTAGGGGGGWYYLRNPHMAEQVGGTLIEPGGIQTPHLAADVLEVGNLKAGTGEIAELVSRKIAAATGQFLELDVGQLTVTEQSKLADVVAEQIAADTAQFMELEADSITAREIAANAIGARAIAADAIEAGKIAADAITGREIAANAIKAEQIVGLSITADELAANSISTSKIVASAVIADKIASNAVTTAKLDALAVTADKIAANAITADKIDANAITAGKIDAEAIDGMTVTGATVRTNASGNRVELNPEGIEAWNGDLLTFNVDRATGNVQMLGDLYSGVPGSQRVVIDDDFYTSTTFYEPEEGGTPVPASGAGLIMGLDSVARQRTSLGLANSTSGGTVASWRGPYLGDRAPKVLLFDSGSAYVRSDPVAGGIGPGLSVRGTGSVSLGTDNDTALHLWPNEEAALRAGGGAVNLRPGGTIDIRTGGGTAGGFAKFHPGTGGGVDMAHVNAGNGYSSRMSMTEDRIDFTANQSIDISASGGGGITFLTDSSGPLVRSSSVSNRTYSNSANVFISPGGNLGKSTSARRYKTDEQEIGPAEYADALLSVPFKSWLDKKQIEQCAELEQFREANPYCPTPEYLADVEDGPPRHVGAVAEDFIDAGLEQFVTFDQYGRVDGLQYDRIGVALIPVIKGMREQIDRLEAANGIGEQS